MSVSLLRSREPPALSLAEPFTALTPVRSSAPVDAVGTPWRDRPLCTRAARIATATKVRLAARAARAAMLGSAAITGAAAAGTA